MPCKCVERAACQRCRRLFLFVVLRHLNAKHEFDAPAAHPHVDVPGQTSLGPGHARLDAIAADQLGGGGDACARERGDTRVCLEVGVERLRSRGEELLAVAGSMAALFVRVTEEVVHKFPLEHKRGRQTLGFRGSRRGRGRRIAGFTEAGGPWDHQVAA